jgi:hypothetical protein
MKDAEYAYLYAEHIIRDRWPEAECYIRKSKFWWEYYQEFINGNTSKL